MKALQRLASRLTGLACWPFIGEVSGLEHVPKTGACLLAANHLSVFDGVALGVVMNNYLRHAHFVSYKYLFEDPFTGYFLRLNEGIVLDDSNPEGKDWTLQECRRLLGEGRLVAIFPEGHTRPYEQMGKARSGAAMLALETGAPVLPAGLIDTHMVIPRKGELPGRRWKRVRVKFGPMLDFSAHSEAFRSAQRRERLDIVVGVGTIIMRSIAALSGQEYRHGAKALKRMQALVPAGAG
jgi:1-acyl-sn-glycerol-3-phosphate acyltransferase